MVDSVPRARVKTNLYVVCIHAHYEPNAFRISCMRYARAAERACHGAVTSWSRISALRRGRGLHFARPFRVEAAYFLRAMERHEWNKARAIWGRLFNSARFPAAI